MCRRLILVDLSWTRDKDPRVPLGHASLLASLGANADIEVRSLVFSVNQGLVARQPRGNQALYRVVDPTVAELCELVCGSLADQRAGELEVLEGTGI